MRIRLDRVLVVGVLGGTGTGKSTLLNALVGQRVCQAGDIVRPTTTRPVVLADPEVDISFLQFGDAQPEVHALSAPLLKQMILIDCPDPDTQSSGDDDSRDHNLDTRNLDTLRRVLPLCDVLICTGTGQKYKTERVTHELLQHAAGRQAIFVQTHADIDADITADWQRHLESQGFSVPQIFLVDSEITLERRDQGLPPPPEMTRLVGFLEEQLSARAQHRILRANALDLLSWFLVEVQREVDGALPAVARLQAAVEAERARLFGQIRGRIEEQLRGNQGVWRARLLREVTLRWAGGPFAGFLRLLGSARSLLGFLPALRARGLGTMLVTGGIGVGKAVADRVRQSMAESNWLDLAELGFTPGEVAQSQSVLAGFARDAGIESASENRPRNTGEEDSIANSAQRLDAVCRRGSCGHYSTALRPPRRRRFARDV